MMVEASKVGQPEDSTNVCFRTITVFPRIDAAAFIYFIVQFGAATIRGRRLFEGGVYYFGQYDRARTQHP